MEPRSRGGQSRAGAPRASLEPPQSFSHMATSVHMS